MVLNFRLKLFLVFLAFAVTLASGVIGYLYSQIASIPEEMTRDSLLAAVANAAARIDAADVASLVAHPDPIATDTYQRLLATLRAIDDDPPHIGPGGIRQAEKGYEKDIYLLVRTPHPGVGRLLVTINPDDAGRTYDMARFPAMMAGWIAVSADPGITRDEYGMSLSAYSPIRGGDDDETVAVLGMDIPARYIEEMNRTLAFTTLSVFVICVLASAVPAFLLSARLNRPLNMLRQGMDEVSRGNLQAHIPAIHTGDEFESLILQFNRMADGLSEGERMKRSLELAREIQQKLLPKESPRLPGFEVSGHVEYCDETGGDFYDFIENPGGARDRLGIAVGDVTGHGIAAALLMASVRSALRSRADHYPERLDLLLRTINTSMVRDTEQRSLVTLAYGVLDARARTFLYTSAGHEAVLWFRAATGAIEELKSTGLPLGILEEAEFPQAGPVQLAAGDLLVVGTDGIREAFDPAGDQFGSARFQSLVKENAAKPAAGVHAAIVAGVREFCGGGAPRDDITLVVVKAL